VTLDDTLLKEAREARNRVIDLDYEAERARLSYQHAIRRLHATGGSLRDIAEALGLSHQRVHQIVEGVEGKVAIKGARAGIECSFCGLPKEATRRVIAGPGAVFICDRCISLATELVHEGEINADEGMHLSAGSKPSTKCSFCGKKAQNTSQMVETGEVRICGECLELCNEIIVGISRR
jgi:heterodisulfide reductase subunit A-like polyferredoxin